MYSVDKYVADMYFSASVDFTKLLF